MQTINRGGNQRLERPEHQNVDNWCFRQTKNKPQTNTLSAPMVLMYIGGSHMAWGTATPAIRKQEWFLNTAESEQTIVLVSWYFGAIIGAVLLFFINQRLTRKLLYIAAASICAGSSALMIIFPQNYQILIVVRLFAGIGHSLAFISALFHGAENCINKMRPQVTGMMALGIIPGMLFTTLLVSIYAEYDTGDLPFEVNTLIGILNGIFAVSAIILSMFLTIESVVVAAESGNDQRAVALMAQLRREPIDNLQLQYDYQEIKAMLEEDKDQNISPLQEGNGQALSIVLLARLLLVLTMNYAFNQIKLEMASAVVPQDLSPSVGYAIRMFVLAIAYFFADSIGRRQLLIFSGALVGVCIVVMRICSSVIDNEDQVISGLVSFMLDGAVGIGIAYIPDVLMSEVFPHKKKLASAMIAMIMENVLQIILIGTLFPLTTNDYGFAVLVVTGVLVMAITGIISYRMPVIWPNSTLRDTRGLFKERKMGHRLV